MVREGLSWGKAVAKNLAYECATVSGERVIRPRPSSQWQGHFDPFAVDTPKMPLFLRFARLDGEDDYVKFAHAWGLLETQSPKGCERVSEWKKRISKFNSELRVLGVDQDPPGGLLRMKHGSRGVEVPIANLKAVLLEGEIGVDGMIGRPTLLYEPENLWQAIRLQFGKYIAVSGTVQFCAHCAKPFARGGSSGRRKVAIYCDRTCNDKANNLKKAVAS